ncbi:phosphonate ABC transporter ATP-binding protein [Paraburkholderia sp. DHOC27]|uniref:phosphonate ABC transporter ATP-binding protein n=1 Tax=Paraburkholderia sp. DHOC27 TaxID=2303330 RepID=UPI000E3C2108|nr:phosphonate ABC transporter ATP-binding protein [Paraburkholderia sp. DHOC27]RFU49271.1 phosphonate ABC transporter ATP-binding protein [Paraburkholderia sp. DHOC27]
MDVYAKRASCTQPPRTASLRVSDVRKHLDGVDVLRNVSLTIEAGQFVALLGASGAGKTTLLRCVAGLDSINGGEIAVAGAVLSALRHRARRQVAVIFQRFNLVQRLSALDNVLAGRLGHVSAWRGITRRFERADRLLALECLERVGLLDYAMRRVDTLSGGQQQRVAIARALAQQPDLIVADEPVASLDPHSSAEVLSLLRGCCREQNVAVLCSLHQVSWAREFADRIVGLAEGAIALDVPVSAFDDTHAQRVYARAREVPPDSTKQA